jgi:hypothetical protein
MAKVPGWLVKMSCYTSELSISNLQANSQRLFFKQLAYGAVTLSLSTVGKK